MRAWIAACMLAGGAAVTGADAAVVSIQDDQLPVAPTAELPARLDALAATGTRVTRIDILWRAVAPDRPARADDPDDPSYDWTRYDAIMRGLAARGIGTVVADIFQTPAWASTTGDIAAAPRASDLAAFAGAFARRYRGDRPDPLGGVLPEVRRIEPWNEPNIGRYLMPQCRRVGSRFVPASPAIYARLLDRAGAAIRAANPRAIVVAGSAGPQGGRQRTCRSTGESLGTELFVEAIRRRGVRVDAWSQHMYPIGSPVVATFFPSWRTLGRIERALDTIRPGIPIYVDETGYHTSYGRAHRYFVSERQQAAWLRETWRVAGARPRVSLVTWFNLQDNPEWPGGILRADGTRKPAYAAFAELAASTPIPSDWES